MKVVVGAGNSLNFTGYFIQSRFSSDKKEQTRKDLQDKVAHVLEELKKT